MDELESDEHKYKQIYCDLCYVNYGVNYYYTHLKSKKHIKRIKNEKNLLTLDNNDNNIRNTKVFLLDIVDKINIFLQKEDFDYDKKNI